MGRPKYEPGMPTARERLSATFWEMLEEMPFDEIAARNLSARAGVNHNTFYRHFQGMDDMARELFDKEVARGFSETLSVIANENGSLPEPSPDDMRKVALYARSGSSLLTGILREAAEDIWLDAVGVRRDSLTLDQRMDCDIIFGGLVAAMGDPALEPGRDSLIGVLSRPLGKGMLDSLRDIACESSS